MTVAGCIHAWHVLQPSIWSYCYLSLLQPNSICLATDICLTPHPHPYHPCINISHVHLWRVHYICNEVRSYPFNLTLSLVAAAAATSCPFFKVKDILALVHDKSMIHYWSPLLPWLALPEPWLPSPLCAPSPAVKQGPVAPLACIAACNFSQALC